MVAAVSPGDASSFQANYQRLVENWLDAFLENNRGRGIQNYLAADREMEGIEIREIIPGGEDKLLYGKNELGKLVNHLTPDRIEQLETAAAVAPGGFVKDMPATTVKVGEAIYLQTDASGQVLVNQLASGALERASELGQDVSASLVDRQPGEAEPTVGKGPSSGAVGGVEPDASGGDRRLQTLVELMVPLVLAAMQKDEREQQPERVPQEQPGRKSEPKQEAEGELFAEFFAAASTASAEAGVEESVTPQVSTSSSRVRQEQPTKSGLDALAASVQGLEDTSVKTVMQGMVAQMQDCHREQPPPDPGLATLLQERMNGVNQQQPGWWQQLSSSVRATVASVRDSFTQYRAASTLKAFARKRGLRSGETYQGASYNLSKQGNEYTLSDRQGKPLLRFESAVLGVKVDKSLPPLEEGNLTEVETLRRDRMAGEGAFTPQSVYEGEYLQRVNRITQALTQYASSQPNGSARVEGKFSYKWRATADGKVRIDAKDGRGPLLAKVGGQLCCRMDETDLEHFEQMLPAIGRQPSRGQRDKAASVRRKSQLAVD